MTKPKEVRDWLKNDLSQLRWAEEYLHKKGIALPTDRSYETVLASMNRLDKERLRLMRLAWNQHGSKVKRQRKTYSFTLSMSTRRQLKWLAAGKVPESFVLERLIELGHNVEAEMKKEWKQAIKEKKADLDQRRPIRQVTSAAELKAKKEANDLREDREVLNKLIAELALKNIRLEVLMEKSGVLENALTPEQEVIAQERYTERMASYRSTTIKEILPSPEGFQPSEL